MRAPFAPPRLSLSRYVDAAAHAVFTRSRRERSESRSCLQLVDLVVADDLVVAVGERVLPEHLLLGHFGPEEPLRRSHVAVRELVPGLREVDAERHRVVLEALDDLAVVRVALQRDVRREHHRRHRLLALDVGRGGPEVLVERDPAPAAAGALLGRPLVVEQIVEVARVPLGRRLRPRPLDAARDGVLAFAGAVVALPAQALVLDRRGLGLGADVLFGVGRAVDLPERVPAGDERDRLLVVHRHPTERLADVRSGRLRVRVAVRPFGVHVDEAHHGRAQALLEFPGLREAIRGLPLVLGPPVDGLVRLERVLATAAESERLRAHRLDGDVPGEDHQVGPR